MTQLSQGTAALKPTKAVLEKQPKISLSEFLKLELAKRNMKVDQLRAKANLSSGNLCRHVNDANFGKSGRRMSVGKAIRIFDALDIPLEHLRTIDWM